MNETLKFSWGHIIAFLAMIAVSYISFMGFTYLTNGNFTMALIGMGITDLVYIIVFIGAQQLKASGVKMKKKSIWERILIFGSPLIFVVGMISMSHFWTVRSRNISIVQQFKTSIENARQLFNDYEDYSDKRISLYETGLNTLIDNRTTRPEMFKRSGLTLENANIQKDNMVETLQLQLLSSNYYNLKTKALKWIEEASQGASTWNVFLLGNTQEIKSAIDNWENQLKSFSTKEMSNETLVVETEVIPFDSMGARRSIDGIDGLTSAFTTPQKPNVSAIIFGIVIYGMLIFPYLIQERHSKSSYTIFGRKNKYTSGITISKETSKNVSHKGTFRL